MKPINIISAYQSILALSDLKMKNLAEDLKLSRREAQSLSKLINLLNEQEINYNCFNGYYISYLINQISKESIPLPVL